MCITDWHTALVARKRPKPSLLNVRMSGYEYLRIKAAARMAGQSLSDWVRDTLMPAADEVVRENYEREPESE